jgi:hypothetical protein
MLNHNSQIRFFTTQPHNKRKGGVVAHQRYAVRFDTTLAQWFRAQWSEYYAERIPTDKAQDIEVVTYDDIVNYAQRRLLLVKKA